MITVRVVKGIDTVLTLPVPAIASAALHADGRQIPLDFDGSTVIIREVNLRDVPVAKRFGAVYDCELVIDDRRIPCQVVANPLRPRL